MGSFGMYVQTTSAMFRFNTGSIACLICSFLILSVRVTLFTLQRYFISIACIILFMLLINTQDSLPHQNWSEQRFIHYYFCFFRYFSFVYKTIVQTVVHADDSPYSTDYFFVVISCISYFDQVDELLHLLNFCTVYSYM